MDKTTGEIVKVGSTIRALKVRFREYDREKYANYFLREAKVIKSTESDWYRKGYYDCPFLWHLIAAEHVEMLKMGTFRKGPLSNYISPLVQKSHGLDGSIGGVVGGSLVGGSEEGRARMSILGKSITYEERVRRARVSGLMAVVSGQVFKMQKVGLGKGGLIGGRKNAESGHCARIAHLGGLAGGKKGSAKTNHIRWHVNRNVIDLKCSMCVEAGD